MQPLVSIIMPAYNAGMYLAEAIESVVRQTYTRWELIIIDDGSLDNTAAIAKSYSEKDKRIHYFFQINSKQGKARNNGIEKSNGTIIAFLDADDIWFENKLAIQIEALLSNDVCLVFSKSLVFRGLFDEKLNHETLLSGAGMYSGQEGVEKLSAHNLIPILTVIVKKDIIIKAGGFIESAKVQYGEDYYLWLKILMMGNVFLGLDNILAAYRLSDNSVTASDNKNLHQLLDGMNKLSYTFPEYNSQLKNGMRRHILQSKIFVSNQLSDKDFHKEVKLYLGFFGFDVMVPFFLVFKIFGRQFLIRFLYFILNHVR